MRLLPQSRRNRVALFYAVLAWAGLLSGVAIGALAETTALAWVLPIFGLAGYVLCARIAMRLWQGGRTIPRPPHARYALAAAVATLTPAPLHAQQTIFNVPSADVLDAKKVYLEVDHLYRPSDPYFQVFTFRGVVGAGRHVEAGINFGGFTQQGRSVATAAPNVKWQPYAKDGFTLTTGAVGLFSLRGSDDGDPAAFGYGHAAYRFPTSKTRLMAGGWAASDGYAGDDSEAGTLFGVEQPIGKFTLAADWFTGENAIGYFTPGLIFAAGPWTIYASYTFKNGDSRGNAWLTELGFIF